MAARKAREANPEQELARLAKRLKTGLPPAVVLRGPERFFADRAIRGIVAAASERGLEICRHDTTDPEFNLASLLDDLVGGALFASARCVVILNADVIAKKTGPKASPAFLEAARSRMTQRSGDVVVLSASSMREDHVLVKAAVAAEGLVLSCRRLWDSPPPWDPDPRRAELVVWLVARARSKRVQLAPDQAAYVVAATGNDLAALDDQLARIAASGGDVKGAVGWDAGGSPYAVADQIAGGEAGRAVAAIEALFRAGFTGRDGTRVLDRGGLVAILLGALSGKVREALLCARAVERGVRAEAAAAEAGFKGAPARRGEFLERASRRSAAEWHRRLEELARLERRARSGATVDATDLAALAFAWRLTPGGTRQASRRP